MIISTLFRLQIIRLLTILAVFCFYPRVETSAQVVTQDSEPKLVSGPNFVLSDSAVAAGIDGELFVTISVDKTGLAKTVLIHGGPSWPCDSSSQDDEIESVRKAVTKDLLDSRFSPAVKDGKPQDSEISLRFKIGKAYLDSLKEKKLIQGGVINGKALSLPKPKYPFKAALAGASGAVTVGLVIDEQGKVILAGALSGHRALHKAARSAACRAEFSPTFLDGKPVRVSGVVTYNFVR